MSFLIIPARKLVTIFDRLPQLWLASQSPRRKSLLENLGLSFQVRIADVDEDHPSAADVDSVTIDNARRKAIAVAGLLESVPDIVIGADTLVVCDEQVLGKPADSDAVRKTLRLLSGRTHHVVTGLALVSPKLGTRQAAVRTAIRFRNLTDAEIAEYAATHEPYDKAGSYAIQGLASRFVAGIEGSYSNVVGLPIERFLEDLVGLSGVPLTKWFAR